MKISIGKGSCGLAAGAGKISDYFSKRARAENMDLEIGVTGCIGMCYLEPIVTLTDDCPGNLLGDRPDNRPDKIYVKVDQAAADEILLLCQGRENNAGQYELQEEDRAVLNRQTRVALRNCGLVDPENIEDYITRGGYEALRKCLREMTSAQIIEEIKVSGLAGRGGAGFPTWFKWRALRDAKGETKYMICNADEGDPGAFMDRSVIESDPHTVIEGMLIGARATGASQGIVYVRAEYPLAIKRLENAIQQARDRGFLQERVLDTDFSFDIRVKVGAGAFVCGEETALIASLEGERGMPRLKPPFPAQKGFFQRPSNINNVETYANVPWILSRGGQAFAAMGTEHSKGTKVFALTGKIQKGGLVEIPMGSSIRDVIEGVGGGVKEGRALKAVQLGGPSGGCLPAELLETIIDYQTLAATGAIMGSGGMVVMDSATCMVDMARFFLDFTCKESCGKCVQCRVGTKRMLEILERITKGEGRPGDIERLEVLGQHIKEGSLCGLGQTAPNPVLTTIRYFRHEYEEHIERKKCAAKRCKALLSYRIDGEKCTGCTLCSKRCPAKAISGEAKKPHRVDGTLCVKCGKCAESCRFSAVVVE
ncbi:MAG: NADH-quinone oxidoreductase subunit NuoF [Clostridiales bacterium]|jgi:NADH-quinone oxidoreductase subunit F|nr:NADH-quinone oxidoreductase subunit NuoF [Clostridiales bacterium]